MSVMSDLLLFLFLIVGVLVGVAFLTLLERSMLGYVQCRKGPNSVGIFGLFQPFADALKLICSEQTSMVESNYYMYMLIPSGGLTLALVMWMLFPIFEGMVDFKLGLLFFLCCLSLGVYFVMLGGWSSNSKYGLLGAYRAVAQTISYEVSMAFILLIVVLFGGGYDFEMYKFWVWIFVGWVGIFLVWLVTCLAELNRTPFDFAEGESELVSGFNVEYAGGLFALIFISEYSNILFLGLVTGLVFWSGSFIVMKMLILSIYFIWMRGTVVRYRYDKLMMLVWKSILFSALSLILIVVGIQMLYFVYC